MRTRSGYVDADWGQVHYRVAGDAGPWIVLFHESPLSSRVYEGVLPELAEHSRVLAFDTPGYGASDPPPRNGFEIPDYAKVLSHAAESLGVTDVVFGGVHTGASIAIEAARCFTGGVAGVVLSGVALYNDADRAANLANWAPETPLDLEGSQFDWAIQRYRRIWPELSVEMLHVAVVDVMRVVERYNWGYNAAFRHDPAGPLASLEVPVLLLDAEHDLLADKDEWALELAQDARLVVMPGLHGQPHLRAPADYARHILEFVQRVGAR